MHILLLLKTLLIDLKVKITHTINLILKQMR